MGTTILIVAGVTAIAVGVVAFLKWSRQHDVPMKGLKGLQKEALDKQLRSLNWGRLQKGMKEGQVRSLLGPPDKVVADDNGTLWRYDNGYVIITAAGALYKWQEPGMVEE